MAQPAEPAEGVQQLSWRDPRDDQLPDEGAAYYKDNT
jgi:hypothetical protein